MNSIREENKDSYFNTMSGDITLDKCSGSVNTMSGDIWVVKHSGDLNTMSGDITSFESELGTVNTMSGDVILHKCKVNLVNTMSGDVTLNNCEVNFVCCPILFGHDSTINSITVKDSNEFNIVKKTWWNPFSWMTSNCQTIVSGNNCTNIQVDGDLVINNNTQKSKQSRTFIIPDTIKVNIVKFDNGRDDNVVHSKFECKVINGKLNRV